MTRNETAAILLQGILANPSVDILQLYLDQNMLVLKDGPGEHYQEGLQAICAELAVIMTDKLHRKLNIR